MSDCDLDTPVLDWVIDTCCGGKSLEFACRQRGLDGEAVLAKLLRRLNASRQGD